MMMDYDMKTINDNKQNKHKQEQSQIMTENLQEGIYPGSGFGSSALNTSQMTQLQCWEPYGIMSYGITIRVSN